jgi:hypothetical protein
VEHSSGVKMPYEDSAAQVQSPAPLPAPGGAARRRAARPVFVDASGRRQRRVRRLGLLLAVPAACYIAVLLSAVLGGPRVDASFLPLPKARQHGSAGTVAPSAPARAPHSTAGGGAAAPGTGPGTSATRSGAGTQPGSGPAPTQPAAGTTPAPALAPASSAAQPTVTAAATPTHGKSTHTATPGASSNATSAPGTTRKPTTRPH